MKCFYHTEKESVAVCTNCGRGVCENCVREIENNPRVYCVNCLDKVRLRTISLDMLRRL